MTAAERPLSLLTARDWLAFVVQHHQRLDSGQGQRAEPALKEMGGHREREDRFVFTESGSSCSCRGILLLPSFVIERWGTPASNTSVAARCSPASTLTGSTSSGVGTDAWARDRTSVELGGEVVQRRPDVRIPFVQRSVAIRTSIGRKKGRMHIDAADRRQCRDTLRNPKEGEDDGKIDIEFGQGRLAQLHLWYHHHHGLTTGDV